MHGASVYAQKLTCICSLVHVRQHGTDVQSLLFVHGQAALTSRLQLQSEAQDLNSGLFHALSLVNSFLFSHCEDVHAFQALKENVKNAILTKVGDELLHYPAEGDANAAGKVVGEVVQHGSFQVPQGTFQISQRTCALEQRLMLRWLFNMHQVHDWSTMLHVKACKHAPCFSASCIQQCSVGQLCLGSLGALLQTQQ